MKRAIFTILTMFFVLSSTAQIFPTTFMGIPVDGTKANMISSLEAKGFKYNPYSDSLEGQFNGIWVVLNVHTNKDKVDRIIVSSKTPYDVTEVKIQFKNLCKEFDENKKYINAGGEGLSFIIPEDEDISYNILVNKKRYEASYFQTVDIHDSCNFRKLILEVAKNMDYDAYAKMTDEEKSEHNERAIEDVYVKEISHSVVWFLINSHYNDYYIVLYYDNEYNRPHGEDL